jgi:phosphoribosyl 1,2-cyclic phosphodiesterase
LARKYAIPVYATPGTLTAADVGEIPNTRLISAHEALTIGDLQIHPYPVPHDAKEPCQCVVGDGAVRLGVLTDSGSLTQHIRDQLAHCDALVLECNHDEQMLLNSAYPQSLKYRIGGRLGHLSNTQAARLLQNADMHKLKQIVAAHLSEKNNTPELARDALSDALGCEPHWIGVMDQQAGLPWREV